MGNNRKKWLYHESEEMVEIGSHYVPLKIIKESRKNVRSSIGKDAVYLRMPYWTNKKQQDKLKSWCVMWLKNKHNKSGVLHGLRKSEIKDGFTINIQEDQQLVVHVQISNRKTGKGQVRGNQIFLSLPSEVVEKDRQDLARKLINNLLSKKYHSDFERRVHELNAEHFQSEVDSVKLRYNYSKWGSCSANNNISLSTRLIFAPGDVVDYVIIHELAHLSEMNHSKRFWKLVEEAMPSYNHHEKWLKDNAWQCDY